MSNKKQNFDESPNQLEKLSYSESLKKLEFIIHELQSEDVSIDELKIKYLEGKKYLDHCKRLLCEIEEEVIFIDNT